MLFPIKAICNTQKKRKDGTSLIYFQYCYTQDRKTLLNSSIAIPPKFWNRKRCCIQSTLPIEYGNYEQLNKDLVRIKRSIEDLIAHGKRIQVDDIGLYVKQTFKPDLDFSTIDNSTAATHYTPKRQPDFFTELDDYIKSKRRKVSSGAVNTYNSMKAHLFTFQTHRKQKIIFNSFDYTFYEDFVDFLTMTINFPGLKNQHTDLKQILSVKQ